jgi:phosphopantetheinyl transferase (holo-ACP synthase)
MVENLPAVLDYWEDPFYTTHFAPAEIAYCSLQSSPKIHFAARWSAKEALMKCDNAFLGEPMNTLELCRAADGQVSLARHRDGTVEALPHAVSISHSDTFAVAIVVSFPDSANKSEILAVVAGKLESALSSAR